MKRQKLQETFHIYLIHIIIMAMKKNCTKLQERSYTNSIYKHIYNRLLKKVHFCYFVNYSTESDALKTV